MDRAAESSDRPAVLERQASTIVRARRSADGRPTIRKSHPQTPGRLRQEFEILESLDIEGVIKAYELVADEAETVLVLEDFGGVSLDRIIEDAPLDLATFLQVGLQATAALAALHREHIVHRDINPSNLVFDPATGQLKIIDFGIASRLIHEDLALASPEALDGTLAYMSPEQTGRMNCTLDARTDIYSLGVTFHELLCGRLPFPDVAPGDALAMAHSHLAREPRPLSKEVPELPAVLERLILRMLAKRKERRYQSPEGVHADLLVIQEQLRAAGPISLFELGTQDHSDRFEIPQRLFGRDSEQGRLLATFQSTCTGGVEALWVTGPAGCGKTALVRSLYPAVAEGRGQFIAGKCDQLLHGVPLSALAQAFGDLARQWMTEPNAAVAARSKRLREVLGDRARLLTDVVPELEWLLGPSPELPPLAPAEADARFTEALHAFIRTVSDRAHPLVVFLDDLQWADAASLNLIQWMASTKELEALFLIGAYRSNEVPATHPLARMRHELERGGHAVEDLSLGPLNHDGIASLLRETLRRDDVRVLAAVIQSKTGGNPFFVRQLLASLHEEGLLRYESGASGADGWRWDLDLIRGVDITTNVVDLVLRRLHRQPAPVRDLLRCAAGLGNAFDAQTLGLLLGQTGQPLSALLREASAEQLITATTGARNRGEQATSFVGGRVRFRFSHDRIQQAAYSLNDDRQQQEARLEVGRLLQATLSTEEQADRPFEIVDHLNAGRALIQDEAALAQLAELNLAAGLRAKQAVAHEAAREYLAIGMECQPDEARSSSPELARRLVRERAEAEYLTGDHELAEALIQEALREESSKLERARLYGVLIALHTMQARYDVALDVGREALALLGEDLPTLDVVDAAMGQELGQLDELLGDVDIPSLIDRPPLTDPVKLEAQNLLTTLNPTSYLVDPRMNAVVTLKSINLALRHGNSASVAVAYAGYGSILCPMFGRFEAGFAFSNLALALCEQLDSKYWQSEVCMVFQAFGRHWLRPLAESQPLAELGFQSARSSGHLQYQGYNLMFGLVNAVVQGQAIPTLLELAAQAMPICEGTGNVQGVDVISGACLGLAELTDRKPAFAAELSEAAFLASCQTNQSFIALCDFHVVRALSLYLLDRTDEAAQELERARTILDRIAGQSVLGEFHFVAGLLSAKRSEPAALDAAIGELKRWGALAPENWSCRWLLLEAERERLRDQGTAAEERYDLAIEAAQEHGVGSVLGPACELAGRHWISRGRTRIARAYLEDALDAYEAWGAERVCRRLRASFGHQLGIPRGGARKSSSDRGPGGPLESGAKGPGSGARAMLMSLDARTVTKALLALGSELDHDKLGVRLMEVAAENAGADRALLILQAPAGSRVLEVDGSSSELSSFKELALSAVIYVERTHEQLLLEDISIDPVHLRDEYVQRVKPRSLLCIPVLRENGLLAILYLENRHLPGAFTLEHVGVLNAIAAQAALSLESARLYAALQDREAHWKSLVGDAPDLILRIDAEHRVKFINRDLPRRSAGELVGAPAQQLVTTGTRAVLEESLAQAFRGEVVEPFEVVLGLGEQGHTCSARLAPIGSVAPPQEVILVLTDISDQKRLEFQLRESQKMDAVGKLAGGVAHDFNNLLTVICGISDMLLCAPEEDPREAIEDILSAGERATALTRQLLTFSRQQVRDAEVVVLSSSVESLGRMLRRMIGEDVIVDIVSARNLDSVRADPGQIEQVIVNLAVNARDAMPKGGRLRIETSNVQVRAGEDRDVPEGSYVMLLVSDDGEGIAPEHLPHIFDPFFTTKAPGQGTGLGLSTIYGIVKQSGGIVTVESKLRRGTTFRVYLPAVEASAPATRRVTPRSAQGGSQCVLMVEDEEAVREVTRRMLAKLGYDVLVASDAAEARRLAAQHRGSIDLLLTDVVMPGMNGDELAAELVEAQPDLRVLLMSGYLGKSTDAGAKGGGFEKIAKPFTYQSLSRRLSELLSRPSGE